MDESKTTNASAVELSDLLGGMAQFYNPPRLQRIIFWLRRKLIAAHEWGRIPEKPMDGFADATFIELVVRLGYADRLRVMLGGKIELRTMLNTEHKAGKTAATTETRIR